MPTIPVAAGQLAAHVTLTANTETVVVFADHFEWVEIVSVDGVAPVYFSVDGSEATLGGSNCRVLPAAIGSVIVHPSTAGGTNVRLISAGAPTISVASADSTEQ